jgi:ornithine cyclodeaminase/alanine dehydrogenase-like protein (mu-crystallin family)
MLPCLDDLSADEAIPFVGREIVESCLPWATLAEAIAETFLAPPIAPPRLNIDFDMAGGAASFLAMPAIRPTGLTIVKLVTVLPKPETGSGGTVKSVLLVMDSKSGVPLILVDGHAITARRTAATSVLAATLLARSDSRSLTIVGTGVIAEALAEAYGELLKLDNIYLWGRRPGEAKKLASRLAAKGLPATQIEELSEAVASSDIVSTATSSEEPLITHSMVRPGTHLDLVGSFRPAMREVDDALVCSAHLFADGPTALTEAGEFAGPLNAGLIDKSRIRFLKDVLTDRSFKRDDRAITLFKSVGTAIEDLAAVELLWSQLSQPLSKR